MKPGEVYRSDATTIRPQKDMVKVGDQILFKVSNGLKKVEVVAVGMTDNETGMMVEWEE